LVTGTFAAIIATTIVAAAVGLLAGPRRPSLVLAAARITRIVGLLLLSIGCVGAASGLIAAYGAADAPGLVESDRQAMLQIGHDEAVTDILIGVALSLAPLLVSRYLRHQAQQNAAG
jgi:hypothetical protein